MAEEPTEGTKEQEPQSFAAFLCQHARGRSERELSTKLRELVEAVEESGRSGSITYTVTVKPEPKAEHAMLVSDSIKVKKPELDRPASIFFADEQYRLVRSDPRQLSFESFTEEHA
jgi:hypothetical protein